MIPDRIWLFGDYNQAESRVVAWLTPVPQLRQWYSEGVDVHSKVCNLIAEVIQTNKLKTPTNPNNNQPFFYSKPAGQYGKGDDERDNAKRTVHSSNYKIGPDKLAIILGVPVEFAKLIQKIYETLFPQVTKIYHPMVETWINKTRTIWMPEPVRFRKVFYDKVDDALYRSAYSCYPQCTVGAMLNRAIGICANVFRNDKSDLLKQQWCLWYGSENWDKWRSLRDRNIRTPQAIVWSGMDIPLNGHDSAGISMPNDPDLVRWAAETFRAVAEVPIRIAPNNECVIPMDFKIGPNMGEVKDYHL